MVVAMVGVAIVGVVEVVVAEVTGGDSDSDGGRAEYIFSFAFR